MKIALLGDIALFGKFSLDNNSELFKYFKKVSDLLYDYDHVIENLETPLVFKGKPQGAKSAYLKSSPNNVELLKFFEH